MIKRNSNVPVSHGLFIDTVNYQKLIEQDSSIIIKNESNVLKIGSPKDAPKKMVYGGRRRRKENI